MSASWKLNQYFRRLRGTIPKGRTRSSRDLNTGLLLQEVDALPLYHCLPQKQHMRSREDYSAGNSFGGKIIERPPRVREVTGSIPVR